MVIKVLDKKAGLGPTAWIGILFAIIFLVVMILWLTGDLSVVLNWWRDNIVNGFKSFIVNLF